MNPGMKPNSSAIVPNLLPAEQESAARVARRSATASRSSYTPAMLDRLACERRVYRLAALLTGDPIAATKVIEQVVGSQPDLAQLDSAHMDRLTVLRSREIRPASMVHVLIPPPTADAVSKLTPQQREAWVIGRVYETPLREMSRAMDCSTTAAERHLLQSDVAIRAATGSDPAIAAKQFLRASLTMAVPAFYRAKQQRRRRMRTVLALIAIALIAILLAAVAMWWSRPLEGNDEVKQATSKPASPPAATSLAN